MGDNSQLPYLIKLLDDESTEIQSALASQFKQFDGDISDEIASLGIDLAPEDRIKLSGYLMPSRRDRLRHDWVVPNNLDDDWDCFEHLLRVLCDFMHDGITLRASLHDSLDLLADDIDAKINRLTPNKLRKYLFADHLYTGARTNYYALSNSDISYTLDCGKGNPITLAIIFLLIANRLEVDVTACNYPGHFLARIMHKGEAHLVDCYNMGRLINVRELLEENKEISTEAKYAIHTPAPPRVILHRVLRNMEHAFSVNRQLEDAALMQRLEATLVK